MRRLLLAVLLALTLLPFYGAPADAGQFIVGRCPYVKSAQDDPIMDPRKPGLSHLHDFLGNRTTDAFSTYASMRAGSTTCSNSADTAAEWVPALYKGGTHLAPVGMRVYYTDGHKTPSSIQTIPADLRMVAGNPKATSPQSTNVVYWGCGDGSGTSGRSTIPSCGSRNHVYVHVLFPDCWDGRLTHVNDTAHLAYSRDGTCPGGFSRPLPQLILRLEYPTSDGSGVSLASGAFTTMHADFWNTWDQSKLDALVDRCVRTTSNCGTV